MREARPGPPSRPLPPALPAQAPPTTRVTWAPRTRPRRELGARGRTGSGGPREKAPGTGWGLGTGPGHRWGSRRPLAGKRSEPRWAWSVVRGGACCWGWRRKRGEGARPTGCQFGLLVYSWRGSFNPKGGRERGKTRTGCPSHWSRSGAEEGTVAEVPRPPRSWKDPAEDALESCVCVCFV